MNCHLPVFKFVVVTSSLVLALSCGSQNKSENPTNALSNNRNSNAASPAVNRVSKDNPHDPKLVCAWLSEFPPAEYELYTGTTYTCKSNQREELGGGKRLSWTYEPFGTSAKVEYVELELVSNNNPAVTQRAENRFVKMAETLWQKTYGVSLPNELKNEMLAAKGKPMTSAKTFDQVVINTMIFHADAGHGISVLKFRFYLTK